MSNAAVTDPTHARAQLWGHIDAEYQQELQGVADGARAQGVDLDVYDIVALNAFEEVLDYYLPWLKKSQHAVTQLSSIAARWPPAECPATTMWSGLPPYSAA